jgi:acyl-CoA synthetase (AMP-forming)/AMP-acid ligase II
MTSAHVGGLSIVTRCLAARRAIALAERFDASLFARWVDAHRVTLASVVPTMLARLLDADPRWTPPPHLRAVLVGGAGASDALVARAPARRFPAPTCASSAAASTCAARCCSRATGTSRRALRMQGSTPATAVTSMRVETFTCRDAAAI